MIINEDWKIQQDPDREVRVILREIFEKRT